MIFFRSQKQRINLKKNLGATQGFFVEITAFYQSDIDPMSGMTLNLVEMDRAFRATDISEIQFSGFKSCLRYIHQSFQKQLGSNLFQVSLSYRRRSLFYDGQNFICESLASAWFFENNSLICRNLRLRDRRFDAQKNLALQTKKWTSLQDCLRFLQNSGNKPMSLEIEWPEKGLWRKWRF